MLVRSVGIAVVVSLLFLGVAYARYAAGDWKQFSFAPGAVVSWSRGAQLRFRGAEFVVARPGSEPQTFDVTPVLNRMAEGLKGSTGALALDAPLNPFSFQIAGFNTADVVSDPAAWAGATATLSGEVLRR